MSFCKVIEGQLAHLKRFFNRVLGATSRFLYHNLHEGLPNYKNHLSNSYFSSFTDKPGQCEVVHTEKTTQLLYEAEPNFWLVLVLNVPKEIHTKDGVEYPEYHKNELHDAIYRRLLIQSYNRFCLEEGTFQMIMLKFPNDLLTARDYLTQKLEIFFNKVRIIGIIFWYPNVKFKFLFIMPSIFIR